MPNPFKYVLIIVFTTVYLSGCATLNKNECKTADWRVIGYEDGSRGYLPSRIGQHREACAEYAISPDLAAYNNGRAEGLHQFCIPVNGYKKGLSGNTYNGVCSGDNEAPFLNAYNDGKELFHEKRKLHKMKDSFSHNEKYLSELKKRLKEKENLLINGGLTKTRALHILNETKDIIIEIESVEQDLHALEHQIDQQAHHVTYIKEQHHY